MRRLLRQFRRPVVILAVLYLAGVGLLASVLPYRPRMILPRRDFPQMLVGFSPDGSRLAVGPRVEHLPENDPTGGWELPADPIQVWKVTGWQPARLDLSADLDGHLATSFSINPSLKWVFWTLIDDPDRRRQLATTNPWGIDDRSPEWRSQLAVKSRAGQFSPDGRLVVRRNDDASAEVVEWQTGRIVLRLPATEHSLAFLADGVSAASTATAIDDDSRRAHYWVRRWSLTDGRATDVVQWDDRSEVKLDFWPSRLHLIPNGRWLIERRGFQSTSGDANAVIVWDVGTGQKRLTVPTGIGCTSVRAGRTVITTLMATDHSVPRVRLFDLETGAAHELFPNEPGRLSIPVPVVVRAPDDRLIAVDVPDPIPHPLSQWPLIFNWLGRIGFDLHGVKGFVALVDTADGHEVARLPVAAATGETLPLVQFPFGPQIWYESQEWSQSEPTMAFSPDGRFLAVLGEDAITIWDLPIRRPWLPILTLAAIPPAAVALLLLGARFLRRRRIRPIAPPR